MLGHQIIIDLYDCQSSMLDNTLELEELLTNLAKLIGATVIQIYTHHFEPQGVSCIGQISASHLSIHTWPENSFASVDIFSCSSRLETSAVIQFIQEAFQSSRITHNEFYRGSSLSSPYFAEG